MYALTHLFQKGSYRAVNAHDPQEEQCKPNFKDDSKLYDLSQHQLRKLYSEAKLSVRNQPMTVDDNQSALILKAYQNLASDMSYDNRVRAAEREEAKYWKGWDSWESYRG
jgi:hypothetical protein